MSRWILFTLAALACGGDKGESSSPEGVGAGGADDTAGSADDTGAETLCPEDVDLFEERMNIIAKIRSAGGALNTSEVSMEQKAKLKFLDQAWAFCNMTL